MFVSRVKDYDEINDLSSCLRGEDALDIRDISHVHSCSSIHCRRTLYWGFKATLLEQHRGPFTRAIVGLFIARHDDVSRDVSSFATTGSGSTSTIK